MEHQDHIEEFRRIWAQEGKLLSEEEARKQFYQLYAFMRLIFKKEYEHRHERYRDLLKEQVADIINP